MRAAPVVAAMRRGSDAFLPDGGTTGRGGDDAEIRRFFGIIIVCTTTTMHHPTSTYDMEASGP
jgi:hypothetical protein